jgi:hypothetical protein
MFTDEFVEEQTEVPDWRTAQAARPASIVPMTCGKESAMFSEILERFIQQRPMAVLANIMFETQLTPAFFDQVFEETAEKQYTYEVTFSTVARLLCQVTLHGQPSVNSAFRQERASIPVSLVSIYDKLKRTEPAVCQALVARSAMQLGKLIDSFGSSRAEPVQGYRTRIVDGNLLAGTQRRLDVLRDSGAAALPGLNLAIYDHATELMSAIVACEDGHANERSIMLQLIPHVKAGDLIIADRNFCTGEFLQAVAGQKARFLVRHHAGQKLKYTASFRPAGKCRTGQVYEAWARLSCGLTVRVIKIVRRQPLKEGGRVILLLTNLPIKAASASKLAMLYLSRWKVEEAFRQLTEDLNCEVNTLGYPKAALLAFALAVVAYNGLRGVKAALAAVHTRQKVEEELSVYYLANEVKTAFDGMRIAVPSTDWERLRAMPLEELNQVLRQIAGNVQWDRYRKSPRGPKKPTERAKVRRGTHMSTARLLAAKRQPGRPRQKTTKRR